MFRAIVFTTTARTWPQLVSWTCHCPTTEGRKERTRVPSKLGPFTSQESKFSRGMFIIVASWICSLVVLLRRRPRTEINFQNFMFFTKSTTQLAAQIQLQITWPAELHTMQGVCRCPCCTSKGPCRSPSVHTSRGRILCAAANRSRWRRACGTRTC